MDRARSLAKRPGKIKGHPPPGDFIALGSKKPAGDSVVPVKKPIASDRKRDVPSSSQGSGVAPKKPKLGTQTFTPLGRPSDFLSDRKSSPSGPLAQYEEIAKEVEPSEFLAYIEVAEEDLDDERIEALLCGAVKQLKQNRFKPDPIMYLSLMHLAKTKPMIFNTEVVIEAFCSLLKRDVAFNFKSKGNALVPVLACNILMIAFQDEEAWPDNFIKVYIEDSLGERVWIDRDDCKLFVQNVQTAFYTKMPPKVLDPAKITEASYCASPTQGLLDDDEKSVDSYEAAGSRPGSSLGDEDNSFPRYTYHQEGLESYVITVLKEQLARRQPGMDTGSRNILRLMTATCGYSEVRSMAAQKLEMWLQNPKLTRPAQELLMSVCLNTNQHTQFDVEVMSQLTKIRLKTKPLINHYLASIRELIAQHPDNMRTLLTHTIFNELSNLRNPNNMSLLSVMFQYKPEGAARILAEVFQDLLANKDDYLRAVRALLREIVRAVRHDMNFPEFALGLMQERTEEKFLQMESQFKDRWLSSIADLVCLSALLSVTSSVREAASAHARGDRKDQGILRKFQNQIAIIQRDAVWWLHSVVPMMITGKLTDYAHCLHKVLFLEKTEHYCNKDNWPPEGDRNVLLRLVSEVPTLEDTLMRVLVIGLSKDLPVNPPDALELADNLVKRASNISDPSNPGFEVLQVDRLELIDALMKLCTYHHPENIVLPKGYTPPTLAISNMYWKAWQVLLIITAFNPSSFGAAAWESYPMLKCFMEMTMTNNFRFPPPTMATDSQAVEDIRRRERQVAEMEKHGILEFESHLAAATSKVAITENNSLLIAQLTTLDPSGNARKPPEKVLEQLRSLNTQYKIGHRLCRSRNPDFLLDIIQRQGTSRSMPWLAELVESSEGSLDVLPVQCLCEFLLHDPPESLKDLEEEDDGKGESQAERHKKKQKQKKQEQLLSRLQVLLHSPTSDPRTLCEVLDYFLRKLSSSQSSNRDMAVKGLSMVLSKSHINHLDDEEEMEVEERGLADIISPAHHWLLNQLPSLPQFPAVKAQACAALRQACQIETDINTVSAYMVFLSTHCPIDQLQDLDELALDMAQLIMERGTLMNRVLPQDGITSERANLCLCAIISLFYNYMQKAREPQKEAYSWSNTQDQVLLQWAAGESATMNILLVHAMIIILTYGKPKGESQFDDLLDMWFPKGDNPPQAFLVDTSEEALLFPDWLKLRMIRSHIETLVDAALQDLDPSQLLLFVQSFGIPRASMSKLLYCLDKAVELGSFCLDQVVVDRSYMAGLIDVQQMRGATGGNRFRKLLKQADLDTSDKGQSKEPLVVLRRQRKLSQSYKTPELPPGAKNGQQLPEFLWKLFGGGLTTAQQQEIYRSLQENIGKESGFTDLVIKGLAGILESPHGRSFIVFLHNNNSISCSLLRLLMAKQTRMQVPSRSLTSIMEKIASLSPESRSPVLALARQYLSTHKHSSQTSTLRRKVDTLKRTGQVDEGKLMLAVSQAEVRGDPNLEAMFHACMADNLKANDTAERTKTTAKLLLTSQQSVKSSIPLSAAGLLVDWLALLDPEVIECCPDVQQQLLFARQQMDQAPPVDGEKTSQKSTQSYLLALLTHQSHWGTLHRCIDLLLKPNAIGSGFNATAVLDFLWACMHIPKIWQGRDPKPPKNAKQEDVLHLSTTQTLSLVNHIISEAVSSGQQATACIDKRLSLLLACCCDNLRLTQAVVNYLQEQIQNNSFPSICQHLLLQLYLRKPLILNWISDINLLIKDGQNVQNTTSQLDCISHRLLTNLGTTGPGKANENRMYDANIACRKLAAEHPLLLLRQLPMISALLKGRAAFSYQTLRHQNNHLLFTHLLGILELLQPYIFYKEYTALDDVLDSYFELVKLHGIDSKQLASLVIKFIKFLHQFMSHDPPRATRIMQTHINMLNTLSYQYPDFSILKSLLAGLTLPRQESSTATEAGGGNKAMPTITPARPSSPWTVSQLAPFLRKISKDSNPDDVLEVLHDLDETSKRKVDILEHFVGDLKRLMCDRDGMTRNTAHMLIMRHIRQDPSCAAQFLPAFCHCLDSGSHDIIITALKNLAEFALLCQEHASVLMQKAFSVGVHTKVETGSYLSEALQLLNMETLH